MKIITRGLIVLISCLSMICVYGCKDDPEKIGGKGNQEGQAVVHASDGGFVFTGVTVNGLYKDDIYLVRLDSSGDRQIP